MVTMQEERTRWTGTGRRADDAAAQVEEAYPDLRLAPEGDGSQAVFRHAVAPDGRLRSSELVVPGRAVLSGSAPRGRVVVGTLLAGGCSAEYARRRIDTGSPFLWPAGPVAMRLQGAHLRLTVLDQAAVRQLAGVTSPAVSLRLVRPNPLTEEASAAWRWVAQQTASVLQDGRTAANAMIGGELFGTAARVLLAGFGEPEAQEPGDGLERLPGSVRRAVTYLEDHADRPTTMPATAAAVGISVRSLQMLFRKHLGVTPLEHLHGIRLDAARRELLEQGAGSSVRETAERWGFINSGRFARVYLARFGERPSDTVRRRD